MDDSLLGVIVVLAAIIFGVSVTVVRLKISQKQSSG